MVKTERLIYAIYVPSIKMPILEGLKRWILPAAASLSFLVSPMAIAGEKASAEELSIEDVLANSSRYRLRNIDKMLLQDLEDGTLDMSYKRAALTPFVENYSELRQYEGKVNTLVQDMKSKKQEKLYSGDQVVMAEAIHRYMWGSLEPSLADLKRITDEMAESGQPASFEGFFTMFEKARAEAGYDFSVFSATELIDTIYSLRFDEESTERTLANCVGLTAGLSIFADEFGIELDAGFYGGKINNLEIEEDGHVMSVLHTDEATYFIENTVPYDFKRTREDLDDPDSIKVIDRVEALGLFYREVGARKFNEGQTPLRKLVPYFTMAALLNPEDPEPYKVLGVLFYELMDFDLAEKAVDVYLEEYPDSITALETAAHIEINSEDGDLEKADELLSKVITLLWEYPDQEEKISDMYIWRGDITSRLGDYDKSASYTLAGIEFGEHNDTAMNHFNISYCYSKVRRDNELDNEVALEFIVEERDELLTAIKLAEENGDPDNIAISAKNNLALNYEAHAELKKEMGTDGWQEDYRKAGEYILDIAEDKLPSYYFVAASHFFNADEACLADVAYNIAEENGVDVPSKKIKRAEEMCAAEQQREYDERVASLGDRYKIGVSTGDYIEAGDAALDLGDLTGDHYWHLRAVEAFVDLGNNDLALVAFYMGTSTKLLNAGILSKKELAILDSKGISALKEEPKVEAFIDEYESEYGDILIDGLNADIDSSLGSDSG